MRSCFLIAFLFLAMQSYTQTEKYVEEPNLKQALLWRPDQKNVWTPVGWKDHFFRFNVMRICPQAWITKSEETVFNQMPTKFGPVDLRFRLSEDDKTLRVHFSANWRQKPGRVVLHIPPVKGLQSIVINNKKYQAKEPINLLM